MLELTNGIEHGMAEEVGMDFNGNLEVSWRLVRVIDLYIYDNANGPTNLEIMGGSRGFNDEVVHVTYLKLYMSCSF
jgi:hypothetical protein